MCFVFVNDYARHSGKESTCQCRSGQETQVPTLGEEDPLEKEIATHSSILAWKIPWTEQPNRLWSRGLQRVGQDWACSLSLSLSLSHTHTHTHHLSLLHIPEFTKAMNNESDLNSSQSLHFWSLLERAAKWWWKPCGGAGQGERGSSVAFFWRRAGTWCSCYTWQPHWELSIIPSQPNTSAQCPSGGTKRSAMRQAPGAVWLVRQPHQGRAQMHTATSASPAGAPCQGPCLHHHSCPSFSWGTWPRTGIHKTVPESRQQWSWYHHNWIPPPSSGSSNTLRQLYGHSIPRTK